jgi:alkaline phosphatase
MRRRDFFRNGSLAVALGGSLGGTTQAAPPTKKRQVAKNIIFMVSDGMSIGTLNMADLLLQRQFNRPSHWLQLYRDNRVRRALMDMASANSMITDSAAASSSWGGGVRVNNGALNVSPDGTSNKPILQKFKDARKAVGCVTTVQITHATPAGFCVNSKSRGSMEDIALQYLDLRFDVMMGGGMEVFSKETRQDKRDVFQDFAKAGYQVATTRTQMMAAQAGSPLLGVFYEGGLPYALDRAQSDELKTNVPTLAEMTDTAIKHMQNNPNGFVLQVESGKVDWAAHANDIGGLLHEQIQFDDALKVAIDFAEKDKNTLVVITTDHGNASPALTYGMNANKNFDNVAVNFKQTNDWILNQINKTFTVDQVIDLFKTKQGVIIKPEDAISLLSNYYLLGEGGVYNARKLPFQKLGQLQIPFTSVGWAGIDHTAEYVELAMFGPGSEQLNQFVKNTDLHQFMLTATDVKPS